MTAPLREPSFSVNLGGGHAVPACTEVGDSPDVQVEFLVMEHRLVRVLHQEVGVADDVPLEYLVHGAKSPLTNSSGRCAISLARTIPPTVLAKSA